MAEPSPERLQQVMEAYGFTEQEARIFIYLAEAEKLFDELARASVPETHQASMLGHLIWTETHTHEHFNALRRHLGIRVLERNFPKGWGYVLRKDDKQEDEE